MEIKGISPKAPRYLPSAPLSLSGACAEGKKLVRFLFLDESGISIHEPILVVAGVTIHVDSQWEPINARLKALRNKFVPANQRDGFAFHATELFHGNGDVFGRHVCPPEKSEAALRELLSILGEFKLPVAIGYIRKQDTPATTQERNYSAGIHHAIAASYCAITANKFLKTYCPDELATAVAENCGATP
jgi:hypothetical protein